MLRTTKRCSLALFKINRKSVYPLLDKVGKRQTSNQKGRVTQVLFSHLQKQKQKQKPREEASQN